MYRFWNRIVWFNSDHFSVFINHLTSSQKYVEEISYIFIWKTTFFLLKRERQIINRDSPKPVPLTWLFMHCLGSSKFVVSEKKIFIHIPIGSYVLVKLYHVEAAALDFWSTEKRKFCKRVFNDFSCTIWAQSSFFLLDSFLVWS